MDNNNEQEVNQPCGNSPKSFGAIILIAVGVILFLDNLGLLPAHARAYSPLGMSAWGVFLLTMRWSRFTVWPWTLIAVGIVLTLGNLGVPHANMNTIWPVFIIALGAGMLFRRSGWMMPPRRHFVASSRWSRRLFGHQLQIQAVFSGVSRRIDSANFDGADLHCTFAELKVDLRGATIATPANQAMIDTKVSFGAIKLRVPETWRVVMDGNAVFGAYEDKTVPPRPAPGIEPPILVIRGDAAFGAVEVEN